jgi:hypothetical protein
MNKFSVGVHPTANTETTIITVPKNQKIIITNILVTSHSGSGNNKTADLWWEHGHDASHDIYLFNDKNFAHADTYILSDINLVIREDDKIKCLTEAGSTFSYIITFELHPDNAQTDDFNP